MIIGIFKFSNILSNSSQNNIFCKEKWKTSRLNVNTIKKFIIRRLLWISIEKYLLLQNCNYHLYFNVFNVHHHLCHLLNDPGLFLAHLSVKLKWAILITFCPASVCLCVCKLYTFSNLLQNHWAKLGKKGIPGFFFLNEGLSPLVKGDNE